MPHRIRFLVGIPLNLKSTYNDGEFPPKTKILNSLDHAWSTGPLTTIPQSNIPVRPFMDKLLEEIPQSLRPLLGDDDTKNQIGSSIFYRFNFNELVKSILPATDLLACELLYNTNGISILILHCTTQANASGKQRILDLTNFRSKGLNRAVEVIFPSVEREFWSNSVPQDLSIGISVAIYKGRENIISSSQLIEVSNVNLTKLENDLATKFTFFVLIALLQKHQIIQLRRSWPIFSKISRTELNQASSKLNLFMDFWFWPRISENSALNNIYSLWLNELEIERQISNFELQLRLHYERKQNRNAKLLNLLMVALTFTSIIIPILIRGNQ